MKKFLPSVLLSFACISTSFALPPSLPDRCPGAEAIKVVPLTLPIEMWGHCVGSVSNFDTSGYWLFVMGFFHARSQEDAIAQANATLPFVYGNPIPMEDDDGIWYCPYNVQGHDQDFLAMAYYIGNEMPQPDIKKILSIHK